MAVKWIPIIFRSLVITFLLGGCTMMEGMMEGISPKDSLPTLGDVIEVKESLDRNWKTHKGLTTEARDLQARVSTSEVPYIDQQRQELEHIGSKLQRLEEALRQLPIQPSYQQLFIIQKQLDETFHAQRNVQDRLSKIDNKLAKVEPQGVPTLRPQLQPPSKDQYPASDLWKKRFDKQFESIKKDGRRIEEKLLVLQDAVENKQPLLAQGDLGKQELSVLQDRQQALEQDVNNIHQDWENLKKRHDFLEEDKAELRKLLERLDKQVKGLGKQVKGLEQPYPMGLQDKQQPISGEKVEPENEMPPKAESVVMVAPSQNKGEVPKNRIRVGTWSMEKQFRPEATQQQAEQTCKKAGLSLPTHEVLLQIARDLSAPAEWAEKVNPREAFAVRRDGVAVIEFRSLQLPYRCGG